MQFINVVIVLGTVGIVLAQWPEAIKNSGFGSGGYNQGMTGTVFLAVLMAGIPAVLFAVSTYLVLSYLLLRRGEREVYEARKLIKSLDANADVVKADSENLAARARHDDGNLN